MQLRLILGPVITLFCMGAVSMRAQAQSTAQSKVAGCPPYPKAGMTFDANPIVDAIDRNHDGKMTHREWVSAGAPEGSWQSFMHKEPHHPPYITRDEFVKAAPPDGIDANCDGKITIQEFRHFAATHHPPSTAGAPESETKK